MKRIIYSLMSAALVVCAGCDKKADAIKPEPPPSPAEYRKVLEQRKNSPSGSTVDIRKEGDAYERASDDEKRKRYNDAKNYANQ